MVLKDVLKRWEKTVFESELLYVSSTWFLQYGVSINMQISVFGWTSKYIQLITVISDGLSPGCYAKVS